MFPFLCSWSYPLFLPSLRHKGKKSWQFFSSYQITPRKKIFYNFSCCSSVAKSCLTLCDPMVCMLGFPVLHHLSEFSQTHVQWVSGCHPTISSSVTSFSSCLLSFPTSGSFPMSWLFTSGAKKYWSFSSSISPSNEYSEFISFRIDWFDLRAVQGTLKSLLQHQSLKASMLRHSAFFMVHLSYPYW